MAITTDRHDDEATFSERTQTQMSVNVWVRGS